MDFAVRNILFSLVSSSCTTQAEAVLSAIQWSLRSCNVYL